MKVLDLSYCKTICSWTVECIVNICSELTELSLCSTYLDQESITIICTKVNAKVVKLDFEFLDVTDDHIEKLLDRCDKIVELGLKDTSVTNKALSNITKKLPQNLISLSISTNYPSIHYPFINFDAILELLRQMPKLRNFYCYGLNIDEEEFLENKFPYLCNEEYHPRKTFCPV